MAQSCFARVSVDRKSVYVQQPFKITITVLTATWYTAPLDFDNIQIPNTFILPFDQTAPGMYTVGNKQYAGLQFYFIAFPYKAGNFSIPSIKIIATTPPEGSSESRKITIKTSPVNFMVKPVPESIKNDSWFVAKNVTISEKWSKSLQHLKVGDVIERTITINAAGTLPQFIPEIPDEKLDFASIYPQDADLDDTRNDYDANGRRTQSIIYLLEKEGDFTISEVKVNWWNPGNSKVYSKSAPAGKIHVEPNPNLGMLTTIRDSLSASQPSPGKKPAVKKTAEIWGMKWYWFVGLVLFSLLLLYILIRFSLIVINRIRIAQLRYKSSEAYWFRHFIKSPSDINSLLKNLYLWWDRKNVSSKSASIIASARMDGNKLISDEMESLYAERAANRVNTNSDRKSFKNSFEVYRRFIMNNKNENDRTISDDQCPW
ncbi:MAG: hypothetical protein C5B52_15340 [Bacteroidetes bacterium]|nr:MAG: hypothetical protein C5B52_15340 [Bacteroidota bacterium]